MVQTVQTAQSAATQTATTHTAATQTALPQTGVPQTVAAIAATVTAVSAELPGVHAVRGGAAGVPFARNLAAHGNRLAVVTSCGESVTYSQLARRVADVAEQLGSGRRLVLVAASNDLDPLVTYLAALAAGHPVLLTGKTGKTGNTRSDDAHWDRLVSTYDPDVVLRPTDDGGWQLHQRRPGSAHVLHPDLAVLLSTSGSTGSAKLVRLSADNIQANAEAIATYLGIGSADRAPAMLPMHYCYGLSVINSNLLRGAAVLLTNDSVVDAHFWAMFRRHGGTSLHGVPYTFDLLDRVGFETMDLPSLRYVTQAGGALPPRHVRAAAELGVRRGWRLFVMYGQTEATARMAYLPPELAASRPAAIGVPIPGGEFDILSSEVPGQGELVYHGPNVMLGYAEHPADLALGRTTSALATGDIARRAADGLYELVGRASRFVKLFGLRIDLAQAERVFAEAGHPVACTGSDGTLVVATETPDAGRVTELARTRLGLPASHLRVVAVGALPRLANGKIDYPAVGRLANPPPTAPRRRLRLCLRATGTRHGGPEGTESSTLVAGTAINANASRRVPLPRDAASPVPVALDACTRGRWHGRGRRSRRNLSVRERFATVLDDRGDPGAIPDEATFASLGGDSLTYVQMSIEIERALGYLPADWHTTPVGDLDRLTPRRRRTPFAATPVETTVVLRALAITFVVGNHVGLFHLLGGAHVLLVVAGWCFARFCLSHSNTRSASDPKPAPSGGTRASPPLLPDRERRGQSPSSAPPEADAHQVAGGIARSAARIAIPAVLWLSWRVLATPDVGVTNLLLVDNYVRAGVPGYWFVEVLVQVLTVFAVVFAIPPVRRFERRHGFAFAALALCAALAAHRYARDTPDFAERYYATHGVLWFFVLGWLAYRAAGAAQKAVVIGVAVLMVPGYFSNPTREAVVMAGLVLVLFVPRVVVPRFAVGAIGLVASASLYIYLTHYAVYEGALPHLPAFVVLPLCLATGVLTWVAAQHARRIPRALLPGAASRCAAPAYPAVARIPSNGQVRFIRTTVNRVGRLDGSA